MVLRIVFAALAALALVACGQADGAASQDSAQPSVPPATATAPAIGSPTPAAPTADAATTPTPSAGEAATPAPSPTAEGPATTATPSPAPLPTPSAAASTPAGAPATGQGDAASDMATRAQAALAAALQVAPETLTLVETEDREWSDSSLGCPRAGEAYMQVIVPGQRMVFTDGNARYNVHTDVRGARLVWCNAGQPTVL